jgi:hypothetical protein
MKIHIWGVLLAEAQEVVDEQLDSGGMPSPGHVVDCVIAAHRFVRGIERYRGPLREEIENYLEVVSSP